MYSIEDFAKASSNEAREMLKDMGVQVPSGVYSLIDLCNMALGKQGAGVLTCKIKGVKLSEALEHGLLLLNGQPYPPKPQAEQEPQQTPIAEAFMAGTQIAQVPEAPAAAKGEDKIQGDVEDNIARIIARGATKAIKFTKADNQRAKVPLTLNGRRILYTIGVWLPIEDKYLNNVLKHTSFQKPRYVLEDGKPKLKVETIDRFNYNVAPISEIPELAKYLPKQKAA
jgi:hypothetical protein